MQIAAVASVNLTIADIERSLDFYTTVLPCKKISDREVAGVELDRLYGLPNVRFRVVKMQMGNETIELTEFLTPKGRPIPADSRSNDRWFQHLAIVVSDMERAYQHLCQYGATQISPNPQTLPAWNSVAGGIQAFYFKDLDGHNLELIHFPEGKGQPRWQNPSESLFLGIDHTAIVVADTAASRSFYCDQLGMKLQQESKNSGLEQEHLSGVSGVQVRISSLRAPKGLGIELLEYTKPNGGRPIPDNTCANDLWFCQTAIAVQNIVATAQQRQAVQRIVTGLEPPLGINEDFFIQDPDGHSIRIAQYLLEDG
ncbi:MAG: VOC family protein [Cyanobacteria bacterium CAN_BIN43]|nr:VOC family protein [Cyanobacteria bacterium CAN_BIN43]